MYVCINFCCNPSCQVKSWYAKFDTSKMHSTSARERDPLFTQRCTEPSGSWICILAVYTDRDTSLYYCTNFNGEIKVVVTDCSWCYSIAEHFTP